MPRFSLSKLNNKHVLSLLGNGVMAVLGLVLMRLLYQFLTRDDVGTWVFFLTTQSVLDSLRNGFLGTATVKFYAGTDAERGANVMGSVWFLAIAITGIMVAVNGLAYLLVPFVQNEQVLIAIKWVGLTIISSLPYSVIFWKLQAEEKYGHILWLRMVNSGSTILAFAVLLYLGKFNLQTALLWNFLTNCLTSIVGLVSGHAGLKHIFVRSRDTIKEVYHFGKFSMATSVSSTMLRTVDTYIITFMLGSGALAVLSLPVRLMELVEIPLRSFVGTGMSGMAAAFNKKDNWHVTYILQKYSGMLTLAFIPVAIAVLFFADIPIHLLGSDKYVGTEAPNIYRFLILTSLLYPIDRFNGVTLDIIHQPKVNFQKVQLMLVVNIVADFACISLLNNVYGVILAGFITMSTGVVFGYINLKKYLPVTMKGTFLAGIEGAKELINKYLRLKK